MSRINRWTFLTTAGTAAAPDARALHVMTQSAATPVHLGGSAVGLDAISGQPARINRWLG